MEKFSNVHSHSFQSLENGVGRKSPEKILGKCQVFNILDEQRDQIRKVLSDLPNGQLLYAGRLVLYLIQRKTVQLTRNQIGKDGGQFGNVDAATQKQTPAIGNLGLFWIGEFKNGCVDFQRSNRVGQLANVQLFEGQRLFQKY